MQLSVPRAGNLPLLGDLPRFLLDPLGTLRRAREVSNVCRLELGFTEAVTLHHADQFDHVFRAHHRNYLKEGPFWSSVRELMGNGLPVSEGDVWRRHRRMMQPQFNARRLAGLAPLVVQALDESLRWTDVGDSWRTLELGARMPHLTMSVASAALLGLNTSRLRAVKIGQELDYIQRYMFRALVMERLPPWLPKPGRRRYVQSLATIHGEIQQIIDERRRAPEPADDLLGLMISATDEETGAGLDDAQLLDETVSLFLAAYETSSTSLQWCMALLGQHAEIRGRLREECDAVLGHRAPGTEDLPRLHYARWCIQEALRLYPPNWWLPRVAADDDEIGGYEISRGTMVAPVMYTLHRHPDLWHEPERFDPERFDASRSMGRHPLAWCPFGAGPRNCIGRELSLMESTLALAMLMQRYDLASSDGQMPRADVKSTLRPAGGVPLRIRRRPRHRA